MAARTTLVLGGTGKTGRRVAERLSARHVPVRIGSRSAERPFDWENSATWSDALQHVGAVYVTYYPDLAAPGAALAIGSFTDLAVKSGVRRLVLLSGRGEPEAQRCEQLVRDSGVEWTLLRASWFCQNFSESFFLEPFITYLFTEVLDGRNASVADGVSRALGRAPRDFAEYVRDAAATGVWNVRG